MTWALLITAFVISTCGLIYELIAGTVASYLLGDSVTQFSTIIGVYLFFMGVGSFLSKYIEKNIILTFVQVELLVGLVGGSSATMLFFMFEYVENFRILLYSLVGIIGVLIGIEIPLLMRILKGQLEFKDLVSKVFTFDYVGALLASLVFPLVLVPYLGLVRSSFLFGIFNVLVAIWTLHLFRKELPWLNSMRTIAFTLVVGLTLGFAFSEKLVKMSETTSYHEHIIYSKSSPYQRIVITGGKRFKLFLNGNLQFNSQDEYRYHEALIHPALGSLPEAKKVLILGGGDGMAAREILKYPQIESITLVDLDPALTNLFSKQKLFVELNQNSLNNPRVKVINKDAFVWLRTCKQKFDLVVVDFPDPSNFSLGKLYTDTFYRQVKKVVTPDSLVVIQSTSPYFARNSFWCVVSTLESVGFKTVPYHAYVPSFGDWGYIIARARAKGAGESLSKSDRFQFGHRYPAGLKYVSKDSVASMLDFPADMKPSVKEVNKLNNQSLVHLFEAEWDEYAETF